MTELLEACQTYIAELVQAETGIVDNTVRTAMYVGMLNYLHADLQNIAPVLNCADIAYRDAANYGLHRIAHILATTSSEIKSLLEKQP